MRSLEVSGTIWTNRAEQISVLPQVIGVSISNLLQFFAWSIDKRLFYLESKLFEEVDLLIVQIVIVEYS